MAYDKEEIQTVIINGIEFETFPIINYTSYPREIQKPKIINEWGGDITYMFKGE